MAEYCRRYAEENGNDPIYWEPKFGPRAPERGHLLRILCEGHGLYEWIDFEGYPIDSLRPELREFVAAMEGKLRKHDDDYKESWKACSEQFLVRALDNHLDRAAAYREGDPHQFIDVANFAMFLWWRRTRAPKGGEDVGRVETGKASP